MKDDDILALEGNRQGLLESAYDGAREYLESLDERAVEATAEAIAALRANLPDSWSDEGMADADIPEDVKIDFWGFPTK